jgi:BRCT domain, a BRCA1 C-terminus domain/Regulator of Ty1 transposition protein 107 BRCT domain/FHA domain
MDGIGATVRLDLDDDESMNAATESEEEVTEEHIAVLRRVFTDISTSSSTPSADTSSSSELSFGHGVSKLGRAASSDHVLPFASISKHHATIKIDPLSLLCYVRDERSTNKTGISQKEPSASKGNASLVNSHDGIVLEPLHWYQLSDRDFVYFGDVLYRFYVRGESKRRGGSDNDKLELIDDGATQAFPMGNDFGDGSDGDDDDGDELGDAGMQTQAWDLSSNRTRLSDGEDDDDDGDDDDDDDDVEDVVDGDQRAKEMAPLEDPQDRRAVTPQSSTASSSVPSSASIPSAELAAAIQASPPPRPSGFSRFLQRTRVLTSPASDKEEEESSKAEEEADRLAKEEEEHLAKEKAERLAKEEEEVPTRRSRRTSAGQKKGDEEKDDDDEAQVKPTSRSSRKKRQRNDDGESSGEDVAGKRQRSSSSSSQPAVVVVFTGGHAESDARKRAVKALGGSVADKVGASTTHLVTERVRRTVKFLSGVSHGVAVVTPAFVDESKKAGRWLDVADFALKDDETEQKFGFALAESLDKARAHVDGLLAGVRFFVTRNARPPPSDSAIIAASGGGTVLKSAPRKFEPNVFIISCDKDRRSWDQFTSLDYAVYSPELLLTSILRQRAPGQDQALLDDALLRPANEESDDDSDDDDGKVATRATRKRASASASSSSSSKRKRRR